MQPLDSVQAVLTLGLMTKGLHHTLGDDYRRRGRARVMGRSKGMVRVWGEVATGRLVGAEMLGPAVEHTAHLLAWAIQLDVTVGAALHLPYDHPVLEEGIRSAFSDLAAKRRLAPAPEVRSTADRETEQ